MTTRDFKLFLEPDEDYGGYAVVCPSLPGCYSQGKSVSEALSNIREAIELCLEDMESRGETLVWNWACGAGVCVCARLGAAVRSRE